MVRYHVVQFDLGIVVTKYDMHYEYREVRTVLHCYPFERHPFFSVVDRIRPVLWSVGQLIFNINAFSFVIPMISQGTGLSPDQFFALVLEPKQNVAEGLSVLRRET